jgi:hypothetical protein
MSWKGWSIVLAAVPLLGGCDFLAPPDLQWMRRAWESASTIVHDPNDRSISQVKAIRALAEAGYLEEAADKVEEITIWMKADGYLALAEAHAGRGDAAGRDRWMGTAARYLREVQGWPRSQLTAAYLVQANRYGNKELPGLVDTAIDQQQDDAFTIEIAGLRQWRNEGGIDLALEKLNGLFPQHARILGRKLQLLEAYLDLEEDAQAAGRTEEAERIAREREVFLELIPKTDHLLMFLKLGDRMLERGRSTPAATFTEKAQELIEELPLTGFRKANLLREAAGQWLRAGEKARAVALLEQAESELLNDPHTQPFERNDCLLKLAHEWKQAGERERYNHLMVDGMQYIEGNGNLRAMAFMSTEYCLEASGQPEFLEPSLAKRADGMIVRLRELASKREFRAERNMAIE